VVIGSARLLRKNYQIDLLLRIFDRLAARYDNLRLKVAGDGPEARRLWAIRKSLKSAGRIEFVGMVPNAKMPAFLQNLDIFAIPSKFESFGVAALEAQACGLPVVGFKVGGLPEVVTDGRSGYLVPAGDADALERAMDDLISDDHKREQMGSAGRTLAMGYDIADAVNKLIELYRGLLGK
jgi:glycosyltransferase involved in cell wall biosynthesis